MTDLWGELNLDRWTWELPRDTPGPYVAKHIPKPLITDWVEKWKPLINDALEKADILDRIEEMGVVTVYDSKHWSTDFNVLKQKLEAIQNWFNDWINPWMLLLNKDEDGFQLSKKRMISLKEILEGETLQNIGESQT